jgi:flagella basal body P-ring formation protein FlgA
MSGLSLPMLAAKAALLLACCALAPAALGAGKPQAAVVTLRAEAVVHGAEVSLGDVATIDGRDARRVRALERLEIGRLAAGRPQLRISRQDLQRRVSRHAPGDMQALVWQGADTAVVRTTAVPLDQQAVIDQAAARLRATQTADGRRVELRPLGAPAPSLVPAAGVSLLASMQPGPHLRRRMRVDVDITVDGRRLQAVSVWFEVRTYAPGWVAGRGLPAGHIVQAGDVVQGEVEVAAMDATAAAQSPVGLRLRRAARPGQALDAPQLDAAPWVSRRQEVVLELRTASVLVESKGVALADGRKGEVIQARLRAEIVRGRVVAPGRLSIVGSRA